MNLSRKNVPSKETKANKRSVCEMLFVCLGLCVHVLMAVPVCKRLRCAHVNNKRAMLVYRTCVADLPRGREDFALISTVTGNNYRATCFTNNTNKPKFYTNNDDWCAFINIC